MNARIKQLAEQAKDYVDDKWAKEGSPKYPEAHYLFLQQRDEKFAELIVRECMTISDDLKAKYLSTRLGTTNFSQKNMYAEGEAACDILNYRIKQHFGIEE